MKEGKKQMQESIEESVETMGIWKYGLRVIALIGVLAVLILGVGTGLNVLTKYILSLCTQDSTLARECIIGILVVIALSTYTLRYALKRARYNKSLETIAGSMLHLTLRSIYVGVLLCSILGMILSLAHKI